MFLVFSIIFYLFLGFRLLLAPICNLLSRLKISASTFFPQKFALKWFTNSFRPKNYRKGQKNCALMFRKGYGQKIIVFQLRSPSSSSCHHITTSVLHLKDKVLFRQMVSKLSDAWNKSINHKNCLTQETNVITQISHSATL